MKKLFICQAIASLATLALYVIALGLIRYTLFAAAVTAFIAFIAFMFAIGNVKITSNEPTVSFAAASSVAISMSFIACTLLMASFAFESSVNTIGVVAIAMAILGIAVGAGAGSGIADRDSTINRIDMFFSCFVQIIIISLSMYYLTIHKIV